MKIIFLITTMLSFQVKAEIFVDKPVGLVDKGFEHQLFCKGTAKNLEYELILDLSDKKFSYLLSELASNKVFKGHYDQFFSSHTEINETEDKLSVKGNFFMFKRIGTITRSAEINFSKQDLQYELTNLKLAAGETFQNPKDYCNPPTRLCGSEPVDSANNKTVLDLVFDSSECKYQ